MKPANKNLTDQQSRPTTPTAFTAIGCAALLLSLLTGLWASRPLSSEAPTDPLLYVLKIEAHNKFERSKIADSGVAIVKVEPHFVLATATDEDLESLKRLRIPYLTASHLEIFDYPAEDARFHNYEELRGAIDQLTLNHSDLITQEVIGESVEGRPIINLRLSLAAPSDFLPRIVFMGGHHAREHLSVEMPLLLAQHLAKEVAAGNQTIVELLRTREVHIIPIVNPDGAEFDIDGGRYKMWRKNRRELTGGHRGVDLNRNYGFQWGTGGSSNNPRSDVYMGERPFSEPETQAIKRFVESKSNINILLSFHTFSELILYPWGHSYDNIGNERDFLTHKQLAHAMSKMNNYKAQQASDLYIASGDTTDWSYGEHGIISFTFELDPRDQWSGGFYPGQKYIDVVFEKNLKPCLYLIEMADNPYRVLDKGPN